MWFSFLFIEHNFQKALCDQNRWPSCVRDGQRNMGLQSSQGREPDQIQQPARLTANQENVDLKTRKEEKNVWGRLSPNSRIVHRGPCMQNPSSASHTCTQTHVLTNPHTHTRAHRRTHTHTPLHMHTHASFPPTFYAMVGTCHTKPVGISSP